MRSVTTTNFDHLAGIAGVNVDPLDTPTHRFQDVDAPSHLLNALGNHGDLQGYKNAVQILQAGITAKGAANHFLDRCLRSPLPEVEANPVSGNSDLLKALPSLADAKYCHRKVTSSSRFLHGTGPYYTHKLGGTLGRHHGDLCGAPLKMTNSKDADGCTIDGRKISRRGRGCAHLSIKCWRPSSAIGTRKNICGPTKTLTGSISGAYNQPFQSEEADQPVPQPTTSDFTSQDRYHFGRDSGGIHITNTLCANAPK